MIIRFLILFSLAAVAARAVEPIIVDGGLSPSKKLAVAIYVDKSVGDLDDDEDTHVYLIDAVTHKKIGPLEEVDCEGGGYGTTRQNVTAIWSPDGRWLVVSCREGRNFGGFELYEIPGRRAIPIDLPGPGGLRKGKFLDYLTTGPHTGESFSKWLSKESFVMTEGGLRMKENAPVDIEKKYGLDGFDDALEKVYQFSKSGKWVMTDIRVPKENGN